MARKFNGASSNNRIQKNQNRTSDKQINEGSYNDVGVAEVFISDDIDLTQESRDYYAEALLENMEENMPPILNRVKVPYEIMEGLSDLVLQANEKVYAPTEQVVTSPRQSNNTSASRTPPSKWSVSSGSTGNSGRSVNIATSKQRSSNVRTRGGR